MTETIAAVQAGANGAYLEESGLVVMEAEHFAIRTNSTTHQWNLKTSQAGYTGTSYLQTSPQVGTLLQTNEISASPVVSYPIQFTTPGTYTVWVRGYAANAAGDSLYVGLSGFGGFDELVSMTGFAPGEWSWANDESATIPITTTGLYTMSLRMREDGLRVDRLLLTTDTTYLPAGFGLVETERVTGTTTLDLTIDRVIAYQYDDLYRLTDADYSTGEVYDYEYDPVGNRLKQIIAGETTDYLYDAANRLTQVSDQSSVISYQFDDNGNLLNTGTMTNTWDAANRLTEIVNPKSQIVNRYNGVNDRVGQVTAGITTTYALDVQGLPEVIYTSDDNAYLHLPGVIVTESAAGEVRYLLSDGLGSVRQVVDENAGVVSYQEFDPYGNVVQDGDEVYGFTGEWWEDEVGLLHLRARWLMPSTGTFLSVDPVESEPPYQYVRGNPINLTDPSGFVPNCETRNCKVEIRSTGLLQGAIQYFGHFAIIFTSENEDIYVAEGFPENDDLSGKIITKVVEDQATIATVGILREDPTAFFATLAEGEQACKFWDCIKEKMNGIPSLDIRYRLLGPNSNSAAFSALKACKLPTSGEKYSPFPWWRSHSGWGTDLFTPQPKPAPTPTATPSRP